jgi:hypothetical protein
VIEPVTSTGQRDKLSVAGSGPVSVDKVAENQSLDYISSHVEIPVALQNQRGLDHSSDRATSLRGIQCELFAHHSMPC